MRRGDEFGKHFVNAGDENLRQMWRDTSANKRIASYLPCLLLGYIEQVVRHEAIVLPKQSTGLANFVCILFLFITLAVLRNWVAALLLQFFVARRKLVEQEKFIISAIHSIQR